MTNDSSQSAQQASLFIMLSLATFCCGLLVAGRLWLKWHSLPDISSWDEFVQARGATYMFLIWNLFLAWIPYLAARRFERLHERQSSGFSLIFLFCIWLLFLPNAPYIITDFLHFRHKPPIPLWYDLILLFAFASTGLLLGLLSLHKVHQVLRKRFSSLWTNSLVLGSIGLSGFGIWLGRFQRWNSWDVFARPDALLVDLVNTLTTWHELVRAVGVSVLLSGILLVGYGVLLAMMGQPSASRS